MEVKEKKPVAYHYTQILPQVYEIEASEELTKEDSRKKILALALRALQDSKTSSFDRQRMELLNCRTDQDLVRVIERTILKGREFTKYDVG